MGILGGSYLKQNIGNNVDIVFQNKRKLNRNCCILSSLQLETAKISDFEGFAFGVFLSLLSGKRRTQNLQNRQYSIVWARLWTKIHLQSNLSVRTPLGTDTSLTRTPL